MKQSVALDRRLGQQPVKAALANVPARQRLWTEATPTPAILSKLSKVIFCTTMTLRLSLLGCILSCPMI